jgi:putative ABC transport system permease protein
VSLRGMVSTFVFGVATGDPVTYALAALAFCGVALVAILIPARRAARIDPTEALRAD